MKKCPRCSKEFNDNTAFCDICGVALEETKSVYTNSESTPPNPADTQASQAYGPQQPVTPANNNPNKKYTIALIIAAIIIVILLFSKCSSSDKSTQTASNNATTVPITSAQSVTSAPTAKPTQKPQPTPTPAPVAKEFIKENYGYVDYKELARNPDPYTGKSLTFSGKVIQVIEGDTETQHRIAVNGDYDNVIFVAYPKNIVTSRILDDDYVTVYGTSLGLYSYQSTMGGKITIPAIYLDRIELQQ